MVVARGHIIQYIHKVHACALPGIQFGKIFARTGGNRNLAIIRPTQKISRVTVLLVVLEHLAFWRYCAVYIYRRSFDYEILLIANCEFFHNSQSKESQEKEYAINNNIARLAIRNH